jgi:LacI family transcriptional regulator
MVERRVDGLVLATATRDDGILDELVRDGVPIVLVNRTTERTAIPSIIGDDHTGIGLSTRHIAGLGHTRIGHLAGPRWLSTGLGRYQAFMSWMGTLGLEIDASAVEEADWYQVDPGYRAASALLDRRPDLTAIVTANDLVALGAYRAIRERGLEIGTDVSITGYNDMALLDLLQPPLTSVAVPYRRMGEEAGRTLLAIIEDPDAGDVSRMSMQLPPTLVVRGSTGPPAA